ncbi:unnamed protein product [Rotaria socialis]
MTENVHTVWLDLVYKQATSKSKTVIHLSLCKIDPNLVTFRNMDKCINYIKNLNQNDDKVILIISTSTTSHLLKTFLQQTEELSQVSTVYVLYLNQCSFAWTVTSLVIKVLLTVHTLLSSDIWYRPMEKQYPWRTDGDYMAWWTAPYERYSADPISETSSIVPCRIYTNLELLCAHLCHLPPYLKRKRRACIGQMNISILSQTCTDDLSILLNATAINQLLFAKSTTDVIRRQEAEFMYALLSRDILIDIKSTEEEIIKYFREKCAGNDADLNVVDEFEEYYDAINAIFWYTRNTFLYRLLNKALREQDIDTLYSLRYFIKDLHLKIRERHNTQKQQLVLTTTCITDYTKPTPDASNERIIRVYRGQLMSTAEFNRKILYNTNGFFSVSSFFSTTIHENLAREIYAGNRSSSNLTAAEQSILFQIDIDQQVNKFPYANISTESAFDEAEGEILFTMGSVFRILSVHLNEEDGYWNVILRLTDEEDKELRMLSEFIKLDIVTPNPLESLATLLIRMGSNKEAERYNRILLSDQAFISDPVNLATVFNNLGFICQAMSQHEKAIEYFEKMLEIKLECSPETENFASIAYNNLGSIYNDKGKYDEACRYYTKAVETELNTTNPNQRAIATYYSNIGNLFNVQKRYTEAIEMFERSVEIRLKVLPANHPDMGTSLINISQVFNALGQYEKAIDYLKTAFQNHFTSLPSDHPSLSTVYNNLGQLYNRQGKFKEALEMYEKSLEIQLKIFPANHPDIACTYNNIGANYDRYSDSTKSLEYFDKALEIELSSLPSNHPNIAATYNNMASLLRENGNFEEALMLYEKALEIWLIALSSDHPQVAVCYNNISSVYFANDDNEKSMEYLSRALQIQITSGVSEDHPDFAPIYRNLGKEYYRQAQYENALGMYEKTLKIWLKVLSASHMRLALLYADISLVYDSLGEYERALEYLQKSLEITQNSDSEIHSDFAAQYNQLGTVYFRQGKTEEALELFEKSLEIQLKLHRRDHRNFAACYVNISQVHYARNDYDKAIEYLNKSLGIQLNNLPPSHSSLAVTYNNFGLAYYNKGQFEIALEFYDRALEIQLNSLPPSHPDLATTYNNISLVYVAARGYEKATEHLNAALQIKLTSLPPDHIEIATTYSNLAAALYGQNNLREALNCVQRAYNIHIKILPSDHPEVLRNINWIERIEAELVSM